MNHRRGYRWPCRSLSAFPHSTRRQILLIFFLPDVCFSLHCPHPPLALSHHVTLFSSCALSLPVLSQGLLVRGCQLLVATGRCLCLLTHVCTLTISLRERFLNCPCIPFLYTFAGQCSLALRACRVDQFYPSIPTSSSYTQAYWVLLTSPNLCSSSSIASHIHFPLKFKFIF